MPIKIRPQPQNNVIPIRPVINPTNKIKQVPTTTGSIKIRAEVENQPKIIKPNNNGTVGCELNFAQRDKILDAKIQEEIIRALQSEGYLQNQINEIVNWNLDELYNTKIIQDILADLSTKLDIDSNKYIKIVSNQQEIIDNIQYFKFDSDDPSVPNYGDTVFCEADDEYYKLINRDPFEWEKYEIDWSAIPELNELILNILNTEAEKEVIFVREDGTIDVSEVRDNGVVVLLRDIDLNKHTLSLNSISTSDAKILAKNFVLSFINHNTSVEKSLENTPYAFNLSFSDNTPIEENLTVESNSEQPTTTDSFALDFASTSEEPEETPSSSGFSMSLNKQEEDTMSFNIQRDIVVEQPKDSFKLGF